MNFLYNTGIHLYAAAARLVAPRNVKAARMLAGQKECWGYLERNLKSGADYVWIHVASLGEFEQARPLIEKMGREVPDRRILLTFFSPSGYEVRKNYPGADLVCYLPFDTPANVNRFLDLVRPVMAIFVKYEFWGNYLEGLRRRDIPTYLISAIFRDSQSFFKWWGGTFRHMLGCYTHLFVQDDASAARLAGIGVHNVTVAGDTRFDRVTDIMRTTVEMPLIERFKSGAPFTFIAGSSWEADEDVYLPWLNSHPDVKAIIAPHEFDAARLDALRRRVDGPVALMSEIESGKVRPEDVQCIIVDCFGKLSSMYRYADVAYIGGGFGVSIHNLNEAAVYDMPVLFGPRHHKFKEAFDLIDAGGGFTFDSEAGFREAIDRLYADKDALRSAGNAAGDYIRRSIGATDRVFDAIFRS